MITLFIKLTSEVPWDGGYKIKFAIFGGVSDWQIG
jgi:hypothetical protein